VAALVGALATGAVGLAILSTALGIRLAALGGLLGVAFAGGGVAAACWSAGATGWLEAVALSAAVVVLQLRQLTPGERRWVAERLRLPVMEERA
jgi:hypothetical protein